MSKKTLNLESLTVIIDTREQRPFEFTYMHKDPFDPKKIITTSMCSKREKLETGDYSIKGLEKEIAIERKNLDDLLGCCGNSRERFEKEIQRLRAYPCRMIAVESSWDEIMKGEWRSQITPNQIMGSIQGWMAYGIPFFFHPNRLILANCVRNTMYIHAKRCFHSFLSISQRF